MIPITLYNIELYSHHSYYVHNVVTHNIYEYRCETCGKTFNYLSLLTRHMYSHRTLPKPYICRVCSAAFSNRGNLNEHIRTHIMKKDYQCVYCKKFFTRKHYKDEHERRHFDSPEYECEHCGEKKAQSSNLYKHMREKHGVEPKKFKDGGEIAGSDEAATSQESTHLEPTVAPEPAIVEDDDSDLAIAHSYVKEQLEKEKKEHDG